MKTYRYERSNEKNSNLIIVIIATILLYRGAGILYVGIITELFSKQSENVQLMMYSIAVAITMAIVVPVLLKKNNMRIVSSKISMKKTCVICIVGIIGALALDVFFTSLAEIVIDVESAFSAENAQNHPGEGSPLFLQLLGEGVAPAISEELVYRGVFFAAARTKTNFYWSALIVSCLFAFSHGISLLTIVTFAGGFLLCYIFEKTGTIIAPIIVHCFHNSIGIIVNNYMKETTDVHVAKMEYIITILISCVLVVLTFLAIKKLSHQDEDYDGI